MKAELFNNLGLGKLLLLGVDYFIVTHNEPLDFIGFPFRSKRIFRLGQEGRLMKK